MEDEHEEGGGRRDEYITNGESGGTLGKRRWRTARSRKVRQVRGGGILGIHVIHVIHCTNINVKSKWYSTTHIVVAWFSLLPPELEIACPIRVTLALATNVGVLVSGWLS